MVIRRRSPEMPEKDVLRRPYENRVRAAMTWNRASQFGYSLEPGHVDQVLRDWGKSLGGLVQYVVRQEHPVLQSVDNAFRSISVMDMVLEVGA
jgi:hypothetical protein